jgi:hypothetical protein
MADQVMAAVDYLVLGFLLLGSRHNEVAMSRRHERRPGGPIKYSRYISLTVALVNQIQTFTLMYSLDRVLTKLKGPLDYILITRYFV